MGTSGNVDYATIQYNADGTLNWAQRYNGPGNGDDIANALALDAAGNAYITGGSADIGTADDYTTIKYEKNGKLAWLQRYNGTASGIDQAYAIAVDSTGNIYVTGTSVGGATSFDMVTVKYGQIGRASCRERV